MPCQRPENYRNTDGTIQCMFRSFYKIEDLEEVRAAFRAKDPHRKFRVFYRGPRYTVSYRGILRTRDCHKVNATHFVVYPV